MANPIEEDVDFERRAQREKQIDQIMNELSLCRSQIIHGECLVTFVMKADDITILHPKEGVMHNRIERSVSLNIKFR